jgi:hypothetical protein
VTLPGTWAEYLAQLELAYASSLDCEVHPPKVADSLPETQPVAPVVLRAGFAGVLGGVLLGVLGTLLPADAQHLNATAVPDPTAHDPAVKLRSPGTLAE